MILGETIEDWAMYAFPGLPEDIVQSQVLSKVCHGTTDKEAGQYASNLHLESLEDCLSKIKNYQYNHKAIFETSKTKEVKAVTFDESNYTESSSDSESEA